MRSDIFTPRQVHRMVTRFEISIVLERALEAYVASSLGY
jgi:hypothetical protein